MRQEVSAGGIVYKNTPQGKVWLITQHSQNHNWSFPKGLIGDTNSTESIEEAALREVAEEGGVQARIIQKIATPSRYQYQFNNETVDKTVWYYLMEYISGDPSLHDWEVSEARFVSSQEALRLLDYTEDRRIFSDLLNKLD